MSMEEQLWSSPGRDRQFIIPDAEPRRPGSLALRSLAGDNLEVDPEWVRRFEVSDAEARKWAREEFGFALEELRRGIDRKLGNARATLDAERHSPVAADSRLTSDAVRAVLELIRKLPGVVAGSLSGDAARVDRASGALAEVETRLGAAGIELGGKLAEFPSRLSALRRDFKAAGRKEDD
jgi:hypothetical protein